MQGGGGAKICPDMVGRNFYSDITNIDPSIL